MWRLKEWNVNATAAYTLDGMLVLPGPITSLQSEAINLIQHQKCSIKLTMNAQIHELLKRIGINAATYLI